jgi:HlyD family secretion protein
VQIEQINEQLQKCTIINPINGTVLTKYMNVNEFAAAGKPIYKVADLTSLNLRAYFTGEQFANVKLNQKVKVYVDDEGGKSKELEGIVEWINNKAEFTPKTIQTKNERANLVYATKIKVKNDGSLKIGMYGEVRLINAE